MRDTHQGVPLTCDICKCCLKVGAIIHEIQIHDLEMHAQLGQKRFGLSRVRAEALGEDHEAVAGDFVLDDRA